MRVKKLKKSRDEENEYADVPRSARLATAPMPSARAQPIPAAHDDDDKAERHHVLKKPKSRIRKGNTNKIVDMLERRHFVPYNPLLDDEDNNEYRQHSRQRVPYPRSGRKTRMGDYVELLPDLIKEQMNEDTLNLIVEHGDKIAYLIVAYFILTAQSKLLVLAVLTILYYNFK